MYQEQISLEDTGQFPQILIDYLKGKPELEPFYHYPPSPDAFGTCIGNRDFKDNKRKLLVKVLKKQYSTLSMPAPVKENIAKLENNTTFTVTTGHQLNIFTGPLYFIFKIVTVINTCRKLKEMHPDKNFVPVFWMASEDHDLDEIRSFTLFGNTYTWETDQQGPVGRMNPGSLTGLIDQLPENLPVFRKAYADFDTLAGAARYYVNELFGHYGLVVIDGDDHDLKADFRDVMADDIENHEANRLVENSSDRLSSLGYEAQVFPRAVNLFYIENNLRGRIIRENDGYRVKDSDISFSHSEMKELIENSPEKLSPNVILRPLYQERVLPNVAYVGGPAEVAYWLQLKDVFRHYRLAFPVLMPRNFGMIIGKTFNKKLQKLQITAAELFLDTHRLKSRYLEKHAGASITLESEKKVMEEIMESVRNKTRGVDKSLEGFVEAQKAKIMKEFGNMEKRLEKAEEKKHETAVRQLENLKEKLFPDGKLQERVENFLSFYINDPEFIQSLTGFFDPFDYRFNILFEE